MCCRRYWRWEALKQSTLLHWKQWGQVSDATRITTQWPCLRFYQLSTRSPTWPLNISSVCLRMVCGWVISPSCGHFGKCLSHCNGAGLCADSLVLEPKDPVMEIEMKPTVNLTVEVVTFSSKTVPYYVAVPKGSTLLEALGILRDKTDGFTWVLMMQICAFYRPVLCFGTFPSWV